MHEGSNRIHPAEGAILTERVHHSKQQCMGRREAFLNEIQIGLFFQRVGSALGGHLGSEPTNGAEIFYPSLKLAICVLGESIF
jgi:hypothetical protein